MLIKDREFHSILYFLPSSRHPSELLGRENSPTFHVVSTLTEHASDSLVSHNRDTGTRSSQATLKPA